MENQTNIPQIDITEPSLPPVPPQKNNYKLLFFIFLTLFLTISIVSAVLLIKNNQKQSELVIKDEQTQVVSSVTPTTVITPTEVITTITPTKSTITSTISKDWKTYTDSTYKLSINYPSEWTVTKTDTGFSIISSEISKKIKNADGLSTNLGPEISIEFKNTQDFLSESKTKSVGDYVMEYSDVRKIIINDISGFSVITGYPSHRIYLQKGNLIIIISSQYKMSQEEYKTSIEKQIIDTLKFN